jgi:membrane protease YdiL (CAAX protease family)
VNPLAKITLYLVAVLTAAVLLSPPIYWACQWGIEQGWLEIIRGFPFHRYFSRTLQVSALVLAVPLLISLRLKSWSDLGLAGDPRRLGHLGQGLLCGLGPLILLATAYFGFGIYDWKPNPEWNKLGRIALTAAAVGTFEELFFRGLLLGLAVRSLGALAGITISSLIFAAVHFLRPAKAATSEVTWLSGWEQLQLLWGNIPPWPLVGYGLATLFLAGWVLAIVTRQTRSLWPAIGLHAGWVFGQQSLLALGKFQARPPEAFLPHIGPNLVSGAVPTGWIPALVVVLSGWLLWHWLRRSS